MTAPIWHSGPPPSIGWWPASMSRNYGAIRFWNPLTNDGDALRLAVKLHMDIFVRHDWTEAVAPMAKVCREPHGSDPLAATRRAITRAAAEIGRTMK